MQSVPDLTAAIEAYLAASNANPEPFLWTATADQILATYDAAASPSTN